MKIPLSTLTLLLAVAGGMVTFAVGAQQAGNGRRAAPPAVQPKAHAATPALPASAPAASREPLYLCACVRPHAQA